MELEVVAVASRPSSIGAGVHLLQLLSSHSSSAFLPFLVTVNNKNRVFYLVRACKSMIRVQFKSWKG